MRNISLLVEWLCKLFSSVQCLANSILLHVYGSLPLKLLNHVVLNSFPVSWTTIAGLSYPIETIKLSKSFLLNVLDVELNLFFFSFNVFNRLFTKFSWFVVRYFEKGAVCPNKSFAAFFGAAVTTSLPIELGWGQNLVEGVQMINWKLFSFAFNVFTFYLPLGGAEWKCYISSISMPMRLSHWNRCSCRCR